MDAFSQLYPPSRNAEPFSPYASPDALGGQYDISRLSPTDRARLMAYEAAKRWQSMTGGPLTASPVLGSSPSAAGPLGAAAAPQLSMPMPPAPPPQLSMPMPPSTGAQMPSYLVDSPAPAAQPPGFMSPANNPKLGDILGKLYSMSPAAARPQNQPSTPPQPGTAPSAAPAQLSYQMPPASNAPLPADLAPQGGPPPAPPAPSAFNPNALSINGVFPDASPLTPLTASASPPPRPCRAPSPTPRKRLPPRPPLWLRCPTEPCRPPSPDRP